MENEFLDSLLEGQNHTIEQVKGLMNRLPMMSFINILDRPGDASSCRTIWMNDYGLNHMGYTMDEMNMLGVRFIAEIMHPDDLSVVALVLQQCCILQSSHIELPLHRIRKKGTIDYKWETGKGMILKTFADGTPQLALTISSEVSKAMIKDEKFDIALKELCRKRHAATLNCFSKRETEILSLIANGKTDKEIALQLFICETTAKKHRTNILKKTEKRNSAELAALAVELGLK